MTAQHDLDRTLAGWFGAEAAAAPPPEPLARILETTRDRRPRPALVAGIGSHWVAVTRTTSLRPVAIVALLALLALALAGGALLVGSRLAPPPDQPRTYLDEIVPAPDLSMPMAYPALVPLLDGRVLVIGDDGDGGGTGTRALVYDPATGISEATGQLVSSESLSVVAAVRHRDGSVLVIGDTVAQILDPDTLEFTAVGSMVTPRTGAGVAVLPDGRVLIAGGYPSGQDAATASAELFDPETRTFSLTGSMTTSRSMPSLAVLPDGRVFVSPGESRTTVETYDPTTGTFSAAGTTGQYGFDNEAISLPDGRVVVIGGQSLSNKGFAEVWDPASLTFSPRRHLPGDMGNATLLDDGRILLLGDRRLGSRVGIFDPTTGMTSTTPSWTRAWWPKATRLADGRMLIVGGLLDGNIRPSGGGSLAPGVPTVEVFQ